MFSLPSIHYFNFLKSLLCLVLISDLFDPALFPILMSDMLGKIFSSLVLVVIHVWMNVNDSPRETDMLCWISLCSYNMLLLKVDFILRGWGRKPLTLESFNLYWICYFFKPHDTNQYSSSDFPNPYSYSTNSMYCRSWGPIRICVLDEF